MPPRRRRTRPLNLDIPALPDSVVPSPRLDRAADGDALIPRPFLAALSVLGLCGGLPELDGGAERAEYAAVVWKSGLWDVDVRGA
jgi:hypothetical protein